MKPTDGNGRPQRGTGVALAVVTLSAWLGACGIFTGEEDAPEILYAACRVHSDCHPDGSTGFYCGDEKYCTFDCRSDLDCGADCACSALGRCQRPDASLCDPETAPGSPDAGEADAGEADGGTDSGMEPDAGTQSDAGSDAGQGDGG